MAAAEQTDNPSSPPPRVRRGLRKPLTVIGCGVVLAALVLIVAMNLDRRDQPADTDPRPDVIDLIEPDLLTDGDGTRELPAAGGIQITNDDGRLAQQYRYSRLDPAPDGMGPGWFAMTEPELELYLEDGDVVVLTGDSALAFAPNRAIESGTLTGNVLIRLYEDIPGTLVDPSVDAPSLAVRTSEARFDNIVGEVACDGDLHLETPSIEFEGRRLKMRINDRDDIIQMLNIAEVEYVRLAGGVDLLESAPVETEERTPAPPTAARDVERQGAAPERPRRRNGEKRNGNGQRRGVKAATALDGVQFYRLTLHDNLRIVQGQGDDAPTVTGDELSVIFSTQSEGLGGMLATGPATTTTTMPYGPVRLEQALYATVLASYQGRQRTIAPDPSADDTYVTCDGALTMAPLAEPDPRITSASDSLVELVGAPVRLLDPAEDAEATCATLEYHTRDASLQLVGSEEHELRVASPQFDATGERFWMIRTDNEGGFTGPGRMRFFHAPQADEPTGPSRYDAPDERLSLAWNDRVDLGFGGDGEAGSMVALRSAEFHGRVHAHSDDLSLSAPRDKEQGRLGESAAGDLRCNRLNVRFEPDDAGRVRPADMIAAGEVEITDQRQTLWAQTLDVVFNAAPPAEEGEAAAQADLAAVGVETIIAENEVQLRLPDGQRVFAKRLAIDSARRTAVLTGPNIRLVDDNNLIDRAQRITIDDEAQKYTLHGGGRFWRFDGPLLPATDGPLSPALLEEVFQRREDLRITWNDGVVIQPADEDNAEDGERGAQEAVFRGDIQVISPRLKLTNADEMRVGFAEGESGQSAIESIDATGDVRSRAFARDEQTGAVREVGDIACRSLHVDIAQNAQGQTVPARLEATGAVRVAEENQTMWTETLTVTFGEKDPAERAVPATGVEGELMTGEVDVDAITAEGGVRILLDGGERIFADRLSADVAGETAELFGDRVLIVTEEFVLDRGRHLVLDKKSGAYEVRGGGEFHAFANPIELAATDPPGGPIEIPSIDEDIARTLDATWTESALYTEGDEGGGSLDLRGDVKVFAQSESEAGAPMEISKNTVDAEALTLQFQEVHRLEQAEPTRELTRFEARGDARLENRTWRTADERDEPRVFYIAAQHIDFDMRTQEALVVGDGELLVRDEWSEGGPESGASTGGFAAKGRTLFRWQRALRMTQEIEDRFNITMTGNVTCMHEDLDGRASKLRAEEIQATVERESADAPTPVDGQPGGLDFGGRMDLKRLYGRGGVFVRTPDHDVACEVFEYNPMTGIAEISASAGGFISVMIPGSPYSTRAERAVWDMNRGVISVTRGSGAGAP